MKKYFFVLLLPSFFFLSTVASAQSKGAHQSIAPSSVVAENTRSITLKEALAIAIQNNIGIQLKEEEIAIGAANLRASQSMYEPSLHASYSHNDSVSPPSSSVDGDPGQTFQNLAQRWSLGINQDLGTGTKVGLELSGARNKSSLGSAVEPLFYGSNMSVSVNQSLLKGFSFDRNIPRAAILKAEFGSQKILEEKRRAISLEVQRTEDAYWNLVLATQSHQVQKSALDSAKQQLELTQQQIQAGILAPADLIGSESTVARRELDVVQSYASLAGAMDRLRMTLNLAPDKWNQELRASDVPSVQPYAMTFEEAIKLALNNRPEIHLQDIDIQISKLDMRVAKNNQLPDLNLGFRYGLTGQSKEYSQSLDQLQGLGARNWGVFVNLNWAPLGRAASARRASLRSSIEIQKLLRQQFLLNLKNEIRTALRALKTSERSVEASVRFRELAQRSLDAEKERFLSGKSRNFELSQREDSLANARTAENTARIAYLKARSALYLATGMLLKSKQINLSVRK